MKPPEPLDLWRAVLIGIFCLLLGMRIYFRFRYRRMWRLPRLSEEGPVLFILHGSLVLAVWIASMSVIFYPHSIAWALFEPPTWLRTAAIALSAYALFLIGWSHVHLGVEFDTTIDASEHRRLVTTGPYRLVRHQLYVGFFAFSLASGIVAGAWIISAGGAALFALLMTVRLRAEERLLLERFGQAYRDYAERTPRFLPSLRSLRPSSGILEGPSEKSSLSRKKAAP